MRILPFVAIASAAAAAGCDFDAQLKACAEAERCVITDANKPVLRFPHNGAGLGSASAVTQLGWSPTRPYLTWDFDGDSTWIFRLQVNECMPGEGLADCPFTQEQSDSQPTAISGTTYNLERDLRIGHRYWWRVRGCHTGVLGTPCGPWSDARYFDVGRPESLPNNFGGLDTGVNYDLIDLAAAGQNPSNAGMPETVYLFHGYPTGPGHWKDLSVNPSLMTPTNYAPVISGAGDLDGDGYTDLAVGYRVTFSGGADEALPVHVFLSNGSAGPDSASRITLGPQTDGFGSALGRAGDVNGDGYSDLAVCQAGLKRVVIYYGGVGGPSNAAGRMAALSMPNADPTSCAFAALSDVNADGYDDIAVASLGQVLVYGGREAFGAWGSPFMDIPAPSSSTGFGASVAAGDFNGDGYGDLVVSSTNNKGYLYLGSPGWFSGPFPQPIAFDTGPGTIAAAGDVNNDGFADLVAGDGSTGQVRIFLGQRSGAPKAVATLTNNDVSSFGVSFAGGGDLTEDTYDDVVVGGTNGLVVYRGSAFENELGGAHDTVLAPFGSARFGLNLAPAF